MSSHDTHDGPGLHPLHLFLYLLGGGAVGTGLILLYGAFGWPQGSLNSDFAGVGFSGLDDIQLLSGAEIAVALIVVGIVCLVFGNATAWRETGGY
jgi:hypothetical protein